MPSIEIPAEVWASISAFIAQPKGHIVLSQVSQTSRAAYSDKQWQLICRSVGLGMGMLEKTHTTWKRVLLDAIMHRPRCRIPQCYQYGAPPMDVVGDLLPDAEAVLQHCEYFKSREAAKPAFPCTCGHHHGPEPPAEEGDVDDGSEGESVEGDDSEEEDEHDEDDDEEEGDDNEEDWEDTVDDPNAHLHAPDPAAMMTHLLSMMGIAAPDLTHDVSNPFPIPGFPNFTPMHPGGEFATVPPLFPGPPPPPAGPSASRPKRSKAAAAEPETPPIKAHLLPLSWKNREHVPSHPTIHPFLGEFGCIQFQRFIIGETCLNPFALLPTIGAKTPVGIDWDSQDETGVDWRERNVVKVKDHPLLARAFATNPPTAELSFDVDGIIFSVINRDGVTIKDVIHNFERIFSKPLSTKDKEVLCGSEPPHVCHLNDYKTRLEYILRDFPVSAEGEQEIKECWLRTSVHIKDGAVTVAVHP